MAQLNDPNGEIVPEEVHINVDHFNEVLADSMSNKLHELLGHPRQCVSTIPRVPEYIRNKDKELYEPQIISIGPYHHGAKSLESIEEQKWRSLDMLLGYERTCSLINLVKVVRFLEAVARSAYKECVRLNSDEFVEMMVPDGCYILHFFIYSDPQMTDNGISVENTHSDLLLLENQIPFFIIQSLNSKISPYKNNWDDLYSPIIRMFSSTPLDEQLLTALEPVHLVHLYYLCFLIPLITDVKNSRYFPQKIEVISRNLPQIKEVISGNAPFRPGSSYAIPIVRLTTTAPMKVIPSATSLKEAGVKFKRASSRNLFQVTFHKGVMEISSVILDNTRKCLFVNLIAFEQSIAKQDQKDLTSFAKLMDMLIDTPKNAAILEKAGILHNLLASAEEASHFFNQICECATVDYNNNYLAEVIQDVRQYCDSSWHKHRARLMRDYFNNPWSIISLVAGIILLILSFLQVYFTVKPPKYP